MFKFILVILVIFLVSLPIFFTESKYYRGNISNHFNGKYFYNVSDLADDLKSDKQSNKHRGFFSYYLSKINYEKIHGKPIWQDKIISVKQFIPKDKIEDKSLHVSYIGHSTFLLQLQGLNILTDPIYSNIASPFSFIGPKRAIIPGINFDDLPKIDIVLISHSHYDHMDLPTIKKLQKKFKPQFITGLGNCYFLNNKRNLNLKCSELDWQDKITISQNLNIHFYQAKHWSKRMMFGRNASLWGAFIIESKIGNIYFAGDTGYDSHFSKAQEKFKEFKLALLPIGAYKPEDFMLKFHLSPSQAIQAHLDLNAKKSIAMHYKTFKLSQENYEDPVIDLEKEKKLRKIKDDFIILDVGKNLILK